MSDRIPCQFFLVRYVPNVAREEFVNIGVILRQLLPNKGTLAVVRFTHDWTRVLGLDPASDIGLLEALEVDFQNRLRGIGEISAATEATTTFLAELRDSLSNSIQITEPRVSLAETTAKEMEQLMRLYVD